MFLAVRARPERRADNLTAICETFAEQYGILNISQPYRPPRPVTGSASCEVRTGLSTAASSQYLTVNCEPIV
jgi:hypothetical protein